MKKLMLAVIFLSLNVSVNSFAGPSDGGGSATNRNTNSFAGNGVNGDGKNHGGMGTGDSAGLSGGNGPGNACLEETPENSTTPIKKPRGDGWNSALGNKTA